MSRYIVTAEDLDRRYPAPGWATSTDVSIDCAQQGWQWNCTEFIRLSSWTARNGYVSLTLLEACDQYGNTIIVDQPVISMIEGSAMDTEQIVHGTLAVADRLMEDSTQIRSLLHSVVDPYYHHRIAQVEQHADN